MRYLIDSHALIWAQDDPSQLGAAVVPTLGKAGVVVYLSAATTWEIGIKVALGKLKLSLPYRAWITQATSKFGLSELPIELRYIERQIALPFHHRDPFDRMLAAQALVEDIPLVSADPIFDAYGVTRIWT